MDLKTPGDSGDAGDRAVGPQGGSPSVCILFIAIGDYVIFWESFFRSCEANFLPGALKRYVVFTDRPDHFTGDRVTAVRVPSHEWPLPTLLRYHFFTDSADLIRSCDYAFFLNANIEVAQAIGREILPDRDDQIVATIHPGHFNKRKVRFPYERRLRSTARLGFWQGQHYFAGGFNGGRSETFLRMAHEIRDKTDIDLGRGIIAQWHDESYLNAYLIDHPFKALDSGYLYPEGWTIPFEPKMVVRDKRRFSIGLLAQGRGRRRYMSWQSPILTALRLLPRPLYDLILDR